MMGGRPGRPQGESWRRRAREVMPPAASLFLFPLYLYLSPAVRPPFQSGSERGGLQTLADQTDEWAWE
jgi:hypothetical protein